MTAPTREQWLAERRKGIGGSDVHNVFNEPPYGCARRLFYDKKGIPADYPQQVTGPMRLGTFLEDFAVALYAERTGRKLRRLQSRTHKQYPWARVNVDRQICSENGHGPGALEVKTVNGWLFKNVKRDGMAASHVLQLQHALFVTGYEWGAFAVLDRDSGELVPFDVERDPGLIEQLTETEMRFWHAVEHGPFPEPLPEIDRRCQSCPWRKSCRSEELLAEAARIPRDDASQSLEKDDGLGELIDDYRDAHQAASEATEVLDLIKTRLREQLGERDAVRCDGARIYYRPSISMRWDTRALDAAHPELQEKFKRPSKSRPLRVYLL